MQIYLDITDRIMQSLQKMKEPVYRWEALRQISKVSRVALANLLKSRDTSLEQAAHAMFPEDIPKGVLQKATINLAGRSTFICSDGGLCMRQYVLISQLHLLALQRLLSLNTLWLDFSMAQKCCFMTPIQINNLLTDFVPACAVTILYLSKKSRRIRHLSSVIQGRVPCYSL